MRKSRLLLAGMMTIATIFGGNVAKAQNTVPWKWEGGKIVTEVPERAPGQQHVLGLTVPKMKTVRVAFVGLGMRGPGAVERFTQIEGVKVVALCDYEKNRADNANNILKKANQPLADVYYGADGYKELVKRKDLDLVYIATDWAHHVPVAVAAMEQGKHVALEVPSAMNLKDIWTLINLSEQKRLHCMILENCVYDDFELNTLNMAQQGVFGEVIRAQGAYIHELSQFWEYYWKNWRLLYNRDHRGDVYATHGLGPVALALDIHRGDKFKTLVAMDTKAFTGPELIKKATGSYPENFRNGDHTTTLISTENGKVVEIQHNVMTPQPYNRLYQLTGTKGFANKYPVEGYAIGGDAAKAAGVPNADNLNGHSFLSKDAAKALTEKYRHPILAEIGAKAKKVGGHGGMDFVMDYRLVYCLQNGLPLDMDVYDLAEWCSLAELGALSLDNGNAPVEVPDFTRGHWQDTKGYRMAYANDKK